MTIAHRCERCGVTLTAYAPEALCPRCMLADGLSEKSDSALDDSQTPGAALLGIRHFGDYELLQEIGRGGMGIVFKARQRSLDRLVAVKMLLSGRLFDGESLKRFRQEAEAVGRLRHTNIVAIHEVGHMDGQHYYSMDYIEGENLVQLARNNPLPAQQAARYVKTITLAIEHAHQQGILHRDLKPSNVMVDRMDSPHVTDFGLAKRLTSKEFSAAGQEITLTGQLLGTPNYIAPEQAAGKKTGIGPPADVYSLGAILYYLLTGRPPFLAETLEGTLHQVLHTEPVEPHLLSPAVPRDLETICLKCLEKHPAKRYFSAQHLAEELGRFLDDEPILARPLSGPEKLRRWCRRRPLIATLTASFTVLVIAIAFVSSLAAIRINEARHLAMQNADKEAREHRRTEEALTKLEFERAQEMFETENSHAALAYLAHLLRQNLSDRLAAQRLISALSQRNFPLPFAPPLRHQDRVMSVRFSPDSQRVVTASDDHTARVWDAHTGAPLTPSLEHADTVGCAEFSPNGRVVGTASADGTARVWDAESGRPVTPSLVHKYFVQSVCFSPDGRFVATGSWDWTARVWDAQTGQPVTPPLAHRSLVHWVRFSPDGRRVATASDDHTARLWDVQLGQPVGEPMEHPTEVEKALFSPDGKLLLTMSRDRIARFWDANTGQEMGSQLEDVNQLRHIAFSPDGERVLTTMFGGQARVWDVRTRRPIGEVMRHGATVEDGSFSPEGLRVLTVSGDNTARIWDAETGQPLTEPLLHAGEVLAGGFSPDGLRVVTAGGDQTAQVWDALPGRQPAQRFSHEGGVNRAEFSPDNQFLVTASWDGTARVWNVRTGQPVTPPLSHTGAVFSAHFSPDGARVLTASEDRTARVWDARTGKSLTPSLKHDDPVVSAVFSPDGERIATASHDKSARVWNARTGELLLMPLRHEGAVLDAQFSPDERMIVTASADKTARMWSVTTGQPMGKPLRHTDNVVHACFSPDGSRVLTVALDKTAQLWDAGTGQPLFEPLRHGEGLWDARFSPNGQWIVTAAGDHTARVWSARDGRPASLSLKHHGLVYCAEVSPDAWRVATASEDRTACLWDFRSGQLVAETLKCGSGIQQVSVSSDSRWFATASKFKAEIFELPSVPLPAPKWLPELAEAVGGLRVSAPGSLEPVSCAEFILLREQFSGNASLDFYSQWVKWFLADRSTRSISPSSWTTAPQWVHERIEEGSLESLREALLLAPTNALAMARLAQRIFRQSPGQATRREAQADWFSRRAAELTPTNAEVLRIRSEVYRPPRDPQASRGLIDLSSHFNKSLHRNRRSQIYPFSNDLSSLPLRVQTLGGVSFDVRGIIQLLHHETNELDIELPKACRGIQVGQLCQSLHFLHATRYGELIADGTRIGQYVLHYADGQEHVFPIIYGEDLRNWWALPNQPREASRATIAWSDESPRGPMRLFVRTWKNPRPTLFLESIDFVSAVTAAAPLLVAITLE